MMIITKEEVEKAANNYAVGAYGVPTITCEETVFLNAEEDFKAGVEFSEEYVQKYVQDIIIENQGLKLYKDNEAERFKKLAIEFGEWILQHTNPSFGIISGYKSPNKWMDTIQGNRIDYTTNDLFETFIKERDETNS